MKFVFRMLFFGTESYLNLGGEHEVRRIGDVAFSQSPECGNPHVHGLALT